MTALIKIVVQYNHRRISSWWVTLTCSSMALAVWQLLMYAHPFWSLALPYVADSHLRHRDDASIWKHY